MRIPEEQWDEIGEIASKISSRSVETSKSSVLRAAIRQGLRSLSQKLDRDTSTTENRIGKFRARPPSVPPISGTNRRSRPC